MGSCGLCLSSAPVVNQLGDQRRRCGKCQRALPHNAAWAATSSGLSDSTPEGGKTLRPAPQEANWSRGDNHGTCQALIWTSRTQTYRGIYERWHTGGKEPRHNAYFMCQSQKQREKNFFIFLKTIFMTDVSKIQFSFKKYFLIWHWTNFLCINFKWICERPESKSERVNILCAPFLIKQLLKGLHGIQVNMNFASLIYSKTFFLNNKTKWFVMPFKHWL